MKLSFGIISLAIFMTVILYMIALKKIKLPFGFSILALFVLIIIISAFFLNVNLPGYVIHTLQIVNAYNDAMFKFEPDFIPFLKIACIIVLSLAFWMGYMTIRLLNNKDWLKNLDKIFMYGIIALFCYVLFKNGFVRMDGHASYFFRGIVFPIALLHHFGSEDFHIRFSKIYYIILVILAFASVNLIPGNYGPLKRLVNLSFFSIKYGEIRNYIKQVSEYQPDIALLSNPALKAIIGEESVDVIPSEISQVYFNDLKYNPRPIIQSYSAYNGYLDSLNQQKYLMERAPDYILFSLGSIDDRYPFFDEAKTKLAILSRYDIDRKIDDQLLLKLRTNPRKLIEGKSKTINAKLGQEIIIPRTSSLNFSKIKIEYSLLGKLKRLFFQPPHLIIRLTMENGEEYNYRAVVPILAGGVIINKFIDSNEEFELLLRSNGGMNSNITKIQFASSELGGFKNDIKLITKEYWLNDSTNSINHEDSLKIKDLLAAFKPAQLEKKEFGADSMQFWVEDFKSHSQIINIKGWGFLKQIENQANKTSVVLRSNGLLYELNTLNFSRPDLAQHFERKDLSQPGFEAKATKADLPPGNYQIGLRIRNEQKNIDAVSFSDRYLSIKKEPLMTKLNSFKEKESSDILFGIDNLEQENGTIRINGWAVIKDEDSKGVVTHLIIQSNKEIYQISTDIIIRNDLVTHFKNPSYLNGGFTVTFSDSKLLKGIYKLGLKLTQTKEKHSTFLFTDKTIQIGRDQNFEPVRIDNLPKQGRFSGTMDEFLEDQDNLYLKGWVAPVESDFSGHSIKIIAKSEKNIFLFNTKTELRPDVTQYFKNKYKLDSCGFSSIIDKTKLPAGKYEIGLYLEKSGKAGEFQFISKNINIER
jgi:hypothetical protein